jgi:hypothetical protein
VLVCDLGAYRRVCRILRRLVMRLKTLRFQCQTAGNQHDAHAEKRQQQRSEKPESCLVPRALGGNARLPRRQRREPRVGCRLGIVPERRRKIQQRVQIGRRNRRHVVTMTARRFRT